jgi:uncharacterized protein with HEPN domain
MKKQPTSLVGATIDALRVASGRIGDDQQEFIANDILQDATLMRLQEAGEYLARIRESHTAYYEEHHTEAWNNLIGLRNIISHGYRQIDRDEIWMTLVSDVPELLAELEKLL